MTPFQESARMAGYICGLLGGDPSVSRSFYKHPGNSLDPENTVREFDRGVQDGEAIRGARMGYLPTMGGGLHGFKEYPAKPRAMQAGDIAGKGSEFFEWVKAEEIRRLRTDAYYFLQYVLASGKMELAVPDYVIEFSRDMMDKPRPVRTIPKAKKAEFVDPVEPIWPMQGEAKEDQPRQRRRNAWVSRLAEKLGLDTASSGSGDG